MRTYNDPSTMNVNYPDDFVFSGDLNKISITKNTTATHVELSYTIDSFPYAENLYFSTNSIDFSMASILDLLFSRTDNTAFDTDVSFQFSIKLYNNTSLLDTENFNITNVILAKRRVFDKFGEIKNLDTFDFDENLGLTEFNYYFKHTTDVSAVTESSIVPIDTFNGISNVGIGGIGYYIKWIIYTVSNFMKNPNFQYLGGVNFWNNLIDFPGCSSKFEVTIANKMVFIIPDASCGDTMEVQYTGGNFVPGQQYEITVNIDTINNPSSNVWSLIVDIGGNQSNAITTTGVNSVEVIAGPGGVLKLIGYMDADTAFGTHNFTISSIKVIDLIEYKINLNQDCNGIGEKLRLRFLNRFGLWRYYYVIRKTENIAATKGISLWHLDSNFSEYNNLYSEQKKEYSQSIQVFREGVSKEIANDFSDIIYTDNIHLWDEINSVWIPIKLQTNTFAISEKETLFDISLNLLLQSKNE